MHLLFQSFQKDKLTAKYNFCNQHLCPQKKEKKKKSITLKQDTFTSKTL